MSGFSELAELPAIDAGVEDVLLNRQVAVGDGGHDVAHLWQRLDRFGDAEVAHIVGGGFCAGAPSSLGPARQAVEMTPCGNHKPIPTGFGNLAQNAILPHFHKPSGA
jgi:hypothetical protein